MPESTNPAKEGKRIYNIPLKRNPDEGATTILISGGMGSVKTGASLEYAEKIMKQYKTEKVFWRESVKSPVQFTKLINFEYKIFVEEGYNLKFKDIIQDKIIELPVVYFTTDKELYDIAQPGILNVVFFKENTRWADFIEYLINISGWKTIIFDEMEDIFPSGTSGDSWQLTQRAANVIKQCRKGFVTIIGNCHKGHHLDYRIVEKMMINMYGFGAKPSGLSRINRSCLDGVSKGEFWVEEEYTRFGYVKIKKVHKPQGNTLTIYES
jgi:hypothetical protein